jgi:4-hydroxybenzoate polyprenyltransferase
VVALVGVSCVIGSMCPLVRSLSPCVNALACRYARMRHVSVVDGVILGTLTVTGTVCIVSREEVKLISRLP